MALLETGNLEYYLQIETLLSKYNKAIQPDEKVDVIRYMHNYAAKMVRTGLDKEWGKKAHEMDKILLKKGDFTKQGLISTTNFNNIINAACASGDSNWAKVFIAEHSQYLPHKGRHETILLGNATVNFACKDFQKVVKLKDLPEFRDIAHVIRSKTLQMRALYELNEDSSQLCDSFEIYLNRHGEQAPGLIDAIKTFVKVFKLLASKSVPKSEIATTLKAHPNMYFRSWLEEKIKTYKHVHLRR